MTSVYLYALFGLTDYNQVTESKEIFGMVLFGIVVASFSINILLFIFGILVKVRKCLKERRS